VVVVGEGQAPGMVPPVVVVAATYRRAAAVVMIRVRGVMMIRILTRFLVQISLSRANLKAMSNREHNLLLSRLLLLY